MLQKWSKACENNQPTVQTQAIWMSLADRLKAPDSPKFPEQYGFKLLSLGVVTPKNELIHTTKNKPQWKNDKCPTSSLSHSVFIVLLVTKAWKSIHYNNLWFYYLP